MLGEYEVNYSVSDAAENQATATRIVNVIEADDGEKPGNGEDGEDGSDGTDGTNENDQHHKDNGSAVVGSSDGGSTNGPGTLPNTATSNPLLIAIGTGLSLIGGGIMFIRRRLVS